MSKTEIFRKETNLTKSVLLIAWQNGLFKIAKFSVCMCKKGHFLLKNLGELFIRKCQTFIFQKLFSEFDYLYYFWNYVVMKCCKRDESYCMIFKYLHFFFGLWKACSNVRSCWASSTRQEYPFHFRLWPRVGSLFLHLM